MGVYTARQVDRLTREHGGLPAECTNGSSYNLPLDGIVRAAPARAPAELLGTDYAISTGKNASRDSENADQQWMAFQESETIHTNLRRVPFF